MNHSSCTSGITEQSSQFDNNAHNTNLMQALTLHRLRIKRKKLALFIFFLLSLVGLIADILIGSQGLTLTQVISAIFHPSSSDIASRIIIWDIRMPMSLMAPFVGGALAIAGAQMQTTLNNPLADPYTFGVSAAAGFGASLVITNIIAIPFIPQQYQVGICNVLINHLYDCRHFFDQTYFH